MRKRLLMLVAAVMVTSTSMFAQCTPDPFALLLGIPGVYPNPVQTSNLASGQVGTAYSETITLITAPDTTIDLSALVGFPIPPVNVAIDNQTVTGMTGLPPGLSHACNIASCVIPGDSSGCVGISGVPTAPGIYNVVLNSTIGITVPNTVPVIGGQSIALPVPGLNWDMEVAPNAVGISDRDMQGFSMSQNNPNPFHGSTQIAFECAKPCEMTLVVRDLTGRTVITTSQRATAGSNTMTVDASTLGAGVYLYTLSNGSKSATRKMVVAE